MMGLGEVAKRMWKARGDPRVRAWALGAIDEAGGPTSRRERAHAITNKFRAKVPYVEDPPLVEFMQGPVQTLCLDDHGLCIIGGDCDDMAITLGALLLAASIHPVWVVGASYDDKTTPGHVYVAFADEKGERVRIDPTTKLDVGTVHPYMKEWWIDPMEQVSANGLPGGEFVGIGKAGAVRAGSLSIGGRTAAGFGLGRGLVSYGGQPRGSFGLGVFADEVDAHIAVLDPIMVAINTGIAACSAMAATDVTAWAAAYEKWQQVKSDWEFDKEGSLAPGPFYGSGILARVQLSTNDAVTYQGKLASACANLAPAAPSPTLTNPGSASTIVEDVKAVGKVIAGVAVTGLVVYAGWKAVEIVSATRKAS
jgi:hypothetical protein